MQVALNLCLYTARSDDSWFGQTAIIVKRWSNAASKIRVKQPFCECRKLINFQIDKLWNAQYSRDLYSFNFRNKMNLSKKTVILEIIPFWNQEITFIRNIKRRLHFLEVFSNRRYRKISQNARLNPLQILIVSLHNKEFIYQSVRVFRKYLKIYLLLKRSM